MIFFTQSCLPFVLLHLLVCSYFAQETPISVSSQDITVDDKLVTSQTTTSSEADVESDITTEKYADPSTHEINPLKPKENKTGDYTAEMLPCPSLAACSKLGAECIECDFDYNCVYGQMETVNCWSKPQVDCTGNSNFTRSFNCRYCYQTSIDDHKCTDSTNCKAVSAPRQRYQANCTTSTNVICLGRRQFYKMKTCNWTSGKRWSTALALSITLGGFGADRFYLGLWKEGIGKLFSFGGLGVWTLLDVVLIGTGYVGPADCSLYIT